MSNNIDRAKLVERPDIGKMRHSTKPAGNSRRTPRDFNILSLCNYIEYLEKQIDLSKINSSKLDNNADGREYKCNKCSKKDEPCVVRVPKGGTKPQGCIYYNNYKTNWEKVI